MAISLAVLAVIIIILLYYLTEKNNELKSNLEKSYYLSLLKKRDKIKYALDNSNYLSIEIVDNYYYENEIITSIPIHKMDKKAKEIIINILQEKLNETNKKIEKEITNTNSDLC